MSKNIVICCDGTGQYGRAQHYTNIARLFTILNLKDSSRHIACYDPGVGTRVKGEVSEAVRSRQNEPGFKPVPAVAPSSALSRGATARMRQHNELRALSWLTPLWLLSERFPRTELQNDPPPPRRELKWRPSGKRSMGKFGRNGVVLIDARARAVYSKKAAPWSGLYPEGKPKSGSCLLGEKDLKDTKRDTLIHRLRDAPDPLSQYLRGRFSAALLRRLREYDGSGVPPKGLKRAVVKELNRLLRGERLYQEDRFAQVELTRVTKELLRQNPEGEELVLLNRWLLADAYPRKITRIAEVEFIETP